HGLQGGEGPPAGLDRDLPYSVGQIERPWSAHGCAAYPPNRQIMPADAPESGDITRISAPRDRLITERGYYWLSPLGWAALAGRDPEPRDRRRRRRAGAAWPSAPAPGPAGSPAVTVTLLSAAGDDVLASPSP